MLMRLTAACLIGMSMLAGCSALLPSQSRESIDAAVLGAAAASLLERGDVSYVMDALSDAPPEEAAAELPFPKLGPALTQEARTAITSAFSAGSVPLFVHDRSSLTSESVQENLGCRPFFGKLVTFSLPVLQPDGSYQVVLFESYGCSGSANLVRVAYIDGQFQVTSTTTLSSWIV